MNTKTRNEIVATLKQQGRQDLVKIMVTAANEVERCVDEEILAKVLGPMIRSTMEELKNKAKVEMRRLKSQKWKAGEDNLVMRHKPMSMSFDDWMSDVTEMTLTKISEAMRLLGSKY